MKLWSRIDAISIVRLFLFDIRPLGDETKKKKAFAVLAAKAFFVVCSIKKWRNH